MNPLRHTALAAACLLLLATHTAGAAALGDPAAPLSIASWVKGEAVTLADLKGKQVAVVEFWATWCPPCRETIPALTKLQKQFEKDVVFIGVSDEEAATVKPFVDKMGEKMEYRVAVDKEQGTMRDYMAAYGQNGIPTAFIVDKESKIVWVGSPMDPMFPETIAAVVAGGYDFKQAEAKAKAKAEQRAKMQAVVEEYFGLLGSGENKERADTLGSELFEFIKGDPRMLGGLAWQIAAYPGLKRRDLDLALKAAVRARELTEDKDGDMLDTHARVLFELGKVDDAIATQKLALAVANEEQREVFAGNLKQYEEALTAKPAAE
jgi:thiol-disulfide isomerase/thioredoxin